MEIDTLKVETKNLIDTLDYEQTLRVFSYAQEVECQKAKPNLQDLKKYWGKVDLDIDLDVLRGRNDFS